MIITHSSLECFKSCRHKYKLRYLDGIVPKKKSDALLFGSAMHAVLEQYFKRIDAMQTFGNNNEPKDEVCESVCNTIESIGIEKIEAAKLKGLMLGYVSKWYDSD